MTTISAAAAYQLWSREYDRDPNPLVALEQRVLSAQLQLLPGDRVLDVATGTGRWLQYALSRGTQALGVDASPDMLAVAATKIGAAGRLALADMCALPFAGDTADVAICSFALGYVSRLDAAFREMARVARRVIVSDLHPDAVRAGWSRSFCADGQSYSISHYHHSSHDTEACARAAGLTLSWSLEASFGEPEREIFHRAGKGTAFAAASRIPAVLISAWVRA